MEKLKSSKYTPDEVRQVLKNGKLDDSPAENTTEQVDKPTREHVREWIKRDLVAASYFLNLLQRYPEIVESMGDLIYEHAMSKENGAAVDHLKKEI